MVPTGLPHRGTASRRFTVFLVDIHSNPFFSRAEPLRTLTELANKTSPEPVRLMGDFNTPADSVHFDRLRANFRNAFEAGGAHRHLARALSGLVD